MPRISALSKMSPLSVAVWLLLTAAAAASAQAQTPSNAEVAAVLADDIHATVVSYTAQRDNDANWPANIAAQLSTLEMCDTELSNLRGNGSLTAVRARYRACVRAAKRISRWLADRVEEEAVPTPTRAQLTASAARVIERFALVKDVASRAGVTLNVAPADAAQMQLQQAQQSGTDAQLRQALRRLRDAVETLHESLPEPTN